MDPFERIKALAHRIDAANGLSRQSDVDVAIDRMSGLIEEPSFRAFFVENLWCVLFCIKPLTSMHNDTIAEYIATIDDPSYAQLLTFLSVHRGVLDRLATQSLDDLSKIIETFKQAWHLSDSVDPTTDNAIDREYTRYVDAGLLLLTVGL